MSETSRIITVFGGSRCAEAAPEYAEALRLGRLLAEQGYVVCSGGYLGVMEAVSRGAHEAGGHVLGITMNQFNSEPNRYLKEKIATDHFYDRLQHLIRRSSGFVALRGGMGTVTEISLVWNKLVTRIISGVPLILVGDCWPLVVEAWQKHLAVSEEDVRQIHFATSAEEAISILRRYHDPRARL
jgi:uncharacterized protein (TIGR00725 family)